MDANELHRLILNLVRKGQVSAIDHESKPPTCRVRSGALETNWLPWLTAAAGETRNWSPPTKGEQVLVLCPCGDPAQGIVLRGLNSDSSPAPSTALSKHLCRYPDGAVIAYDHASHSFRASFPASASVTINAPGSVTVETATAIVTAETVTLEADETVCTGALTVKGPFAFESGLSGKGGKGGKSGATMKIDGKAEFSDDVSAGGVSLVKHVHPVVAVGVPTEKAR